MSENLSSSVDDFIVIIDEDASNDAHLQSETTGIKTKTVLDSRRRLEARLAERQLEKDTREFDFDF